MMQYKGYFLTLAAIFMLGIPVVAQSAPAKAGEQGITRQQADEILNELRQIHQILAAQTKQAPPAPQPAAQPQSIKVSVQGLSILGGVDAPLTLVEFSDYQCAFCRAFHTNTFDQLKKEWIDTGKIRFVSWDLPLSFHGNALKAAQAARCAGEQDKFWEMRDMLIRNASKLEPDAILSYAQQLDLSIDRFKPCVAGDKYLTEIQKRASDANNLGISGTPSFVLGKMNGDSLEGVLLVGAQPYSFFEAQVRDLLAREGMKK